MYTYNLKPGEAGLPLLPFIFLGLSFSLSRTLWRFGPASMLIGLGLGFALAMVAYLAFYHFFFSRTLQLHQHTPSFME